MPPTTTFIASSSSNYFTQPKSTPNLISFFSNGRYWLQIIQSMVVTMHASDQIGIKSMGEIERKISGGKTSASYPNDK
jgi:hypothetical protein